MTHHKNSHRNGTISNDVEKIKRAITHATLHAKDKANEALYDSIDTIKYKSMDAQEAVETYVTEKPLKAVGIALLTGVVVGYLLRKK